MRRRLRLRSSRAPLVLSLALGAAPGTSLGAQAVVLEIRPRVGDTLRLRLDQQTELTGKRRLSGGEMGTTTIVTTLRIFSRAIVERSAPKETIVRAITDSVRLTTTDESARGASGDVERLLEGRSMQLRIARNGTVALVDSAAAEASELANVVSLMPGALPSGPVPVGYMWTREMPLPGGSKIGPGGGASGWLHARLRLDSLSRGGGLAYISMRGEMAADPDAARAKLGTSVIENGDVNGTMVVDRQRGWLAESRFSIVVHSIVQLPGSSDTVMRVETRVTQRMKTAERR
jgi:hypothetical protein